MIIIAALNNVFGSPASYSFQTQDLGGDQIEITAKKPVGGRVLSLQVMLGATASMHRGEAPAAFIRSLAEGGPSQRLRVEFTGTFGGVDANGGDIQVLPSELAKRMLDSSTPTECGTRTHQAVVRLSADNGESTDAVLGLSISYPAANDGASGGGGLGPANLHILADSEHQPTPPADGKACPDRRGYGLFIYADPQCGQDRCYNLTWEKQKRTRKIAVEVDGKKGSGSGEETIDVETPRWVAGNCATKFKFWAFPSYYYCKCDTPQLGTPE